MKIPTRHAEIAAYMALAGQRRPDVRHLPDADEVLARHRPEAAEFLKIMSAGPHQPGPGDTAICMIYRGGRFIMPDNRLGLCHDCSVSIEYGASLPGHMLKMCIFCATKRMAEP